MRVRMLVSFLSTGFSSRATYGVNTLFEEEEKLMDYFEETFVRRMRRSRIVDPLFPMEESHERLEQSHVRERVELGLPRTTNLCEGWHTRFNGCLQVSHPTMYRAIAAVKAENQSGSYTTDTNGVRGRASNQKEDFRQNKQTLALVERPFPAEDVEGIQWLQLITTHIYS